MCYAIMIENSRPQDGLTVCWQKNHPLIGQSLRVVFLCIIYLQNVKTNVSNAKRKIPKVSKSLKSKLF